MSTQVITSISYILLSGDLSSVYLSYMHSVII